jgi:hypothetical protein
VGLAAEIAVHAHPGHSRSEIRDVTLAEFRAQAAARRRSACAQTASPTSMSSPPLLDGGKDNDFPAVLISHRVELLIQGGPDRVDGGGLAAAAGGLGAVPHHHHSPGRRAAGLVGAVHPQATERGRGGCSS